MILIFAVVAALTFPDRPFDPEPVTTSELSIEVSADGLKELASKVQGRPDAECFGSGWLVLSCFVKDRAQVYQMTEDGHPAHPAVFFRGYETPEGGRPTLEERGWFAGDEIEAKAFFERGTKSMVQPEKPKR